MMSETKECLICNNNNYSDNLHCHICKKSICLNCCNKLESRKSVMIADEEIFIKYNCPYCRNENNKHIKLFNKKELLEIYKNNLICYINSYKKNKDYDFNLNILKNYNNILQNELQRKNEEINRLSETLKHVINTNKNNTLNYERLLNLYKNCLVQNGYNKKYYQ